MATATDPTASGSQVDQTGAGAGTGGAGAGQQSQGAAAGVGGLTAEGTMAQTIMTPDIGQAEAYIVNLKRRVAMELDYDAALLDAHKRRVRNAEDFDQQLRAVTLQTLNNAQAVAQTLNTSLAFQVSRHHSNEATYDHAENHETARTGKVDEQAIFETIIANLSSNPIFADAIKAAVSAAVSQAITQAGTGTAK